MGEAGQEKKSGEFGRPRTDSFWGHKNNLLPRRRGQPHGQGEKKKRLQNNSGGL